MFGNFFRKKPTSPYMSRRILQEPNPMDKVKRYYFCWNFLEKMDDDHTVMNKLVLRDEVMFHQLGRVNRRNLRAWGSENPHELFERQGVVPSLISLCQCREKDCRAILVSGIRSDRTLVPRHATWIVHAAAAAGGPGLSTRPCPTALPKFTSC